MKEEYWTTKDGRKIAVGEMTEDHLRNTLRFILRKDRERKQKVTEAVEEWERQYWEDAAYDN